MDIVYLKLKALIASIGLLAGSIFGQGAENATAALTRAANNVASRVIHIEVSVSPAMPADGKKPARIILTKNFGENIITTPTSTPASAQEKKPLRNPFQRPPKAEGIVSTVSPKPQSTLKPSPRPSPTVSAGAAKPSPTLPILSPTPSEEQNRGSSISQPSPSGLGEIGTTPNISIGTLLISNNPPYVKMGGIIAFTVYVRDAAGAVVKSKTLEFVVNGKRISATTDENGNTFLEISAPAEFIGKLDVRVELYGKQAVFVIEVVDTKPSLSLSSFAFTTTGFHVRLRNAAGESVANWQVTETRRDGTVMATKLTNELGVIEFDLPPREAGGHLYACAEVKGIGRQCEEW